MSQLTELLFDPAVRVDDETLAGALYLHARAVEDCLRLARPADGTPYSVTEVLGIAAILMTAPESADGWRGYRWRLPDLPPARPVIVMPMRRDDLDDGLPF